MTTLETMVKTFKENATGPEYSVGYCDEEPLDLSNLSELLSGLPITFSYEHYKGKHLYFLRGRAP